MRKTAHDKTDAGKKPKPGPDADRQAVLDEREKLHSLFPPRYSADIGVWSGDKVEVMLKLTYPEAVNLARLLKENRL